MEQKPSSLTPLGRLISLVLVIGLVAFGAYLVSDRFTKKGGSGGGSSPSSSGGDAGEAPAVVDFKSEVPKLAPAAPFTLKDNIVPIEISEYAGYAGLIAANGGLEPTENSVFFKNGGFKVKLTISEDESWGDLNQGKIAGSVTTVDVLAAMMAAIMLSMAERTAAAAQSPSAIRLALAFSSRFDSPTAFGSTTSWTAFSADRRAISVPVRVSVAARSRRAVSSATRTVAS